METPMPQDPPQTEYRENLTPPFLKESEIEDKLRGHPKLKAFWEQQDTLVILRSQPSANDPVFEVQLALDLGDRLETYAWVWLEALEGEILKIFPED